MAAKPPAGWFPRRGEVYRVALPGGKMRPAVVLSLDALNKHALDVCVIPLTTIHHAEFSLRVRIPTGEGDLERDSWAKGDQVHTVEKASLVYPSLGRVSMGTMQKIEDAVRTTLQL